MLGSLQVMDGGQPLPLGGRRQRLVLAVLLASANEEVSTDRLVDDVWGEEPPATALKSLQTYVSRLRKILVGDAIATRPRGYLLHTAPGEIDAERFERLAEEGHRLLFSDPRAAAALLSQALDLWHGMPWGDLADESALRPVAERLRNIRQATVEDRIEANLALGHASMMIGELESLVSEHPLQERLRGLLMLALYREGRQAEALRGYQETRRLLGEQLGIEPSPELQQLEDRILLHDPGLDAPRASLPADSLMTTAPNPYRGLRAFGEEDAAVFFGREALTAELTRRVAEERFVAVVGPSGSGKSSVVRAGLIPALRDGAVPGSERWLIVQMLPGAHPFEELQAALLRVAPEAATNLNEQMRGDDLDLLRSVLRILPSDQTHLVLVIDQFEELFQLTKDEEQRARFMRNLVEASEDPHNRLSVVVTLRADFFDRPLDHPALASLVVEGQTSVLPKSASELEAAIVRPAAGAGVSVEPELIAEMVADVSNQPGALPLFEFVLTEMFDQRTSDMLTMTGYRRLGGLRGALSRRGDELFDHLDHERQDAARQVFLRLVTLGEGTEDTRRRVHKSEIEALEIDQGATTEILRSFGDARLLSFDRDAVRNEPTVEVAHEALLREWPRLRGWIDESRRELHTHQMLAAATEEWSAAGKDVDYLLGGSRLALYDEWSAETSMVLTSSEREYLDTSLTRRSEEESEAAERRQKEFGLQRRSSRRLRALVAVMAVATIVAIALTAFALNRSAEAQRAHEQELIASQTIRIKELTAAAVANRDVDPELGMILALHAVKLSQIIETPVPPETVAALHWVLQAARVQYPISDAPTAVLIGPAGPQGVFDMEFPDLVELALGQVSRQLTPGECSVYFENDVCPTLPPALAETITVDGLHKTGGSAEQPLADTHVTVLGLIGGVEAVAFVAEMERFTERTGIRVEYDGLDAFEVRLAEKIEAGEAPDLALIPQPSMVAAGANEGILMDLSSYLDMDTMVNDYSPHLLALDTVGGDGAWPSDEGALYGVFVRASVKSLVWYPVPEFHDAGYEIPASWDELIALTKQMVADGRVPWCHGEGDFSGAYGWPGTDWIEDLVLHESGAAAFDEWVSHDIAFDSPIIRAAWDKLATALLTDGHVYRGQESAATLPWWLAIGPMFEEPPGCWLYHQASFMGSQLPYGVYPGRDTAFFPFPTISPEHGQAVLGGGDSIVAFRDRPEVRELVRYMASADFGIEMAKIDPGFIAPNRRFPLDEYQICDGDDSETRTCRPNELTRHLAELLGQSLAEDSFRFDGSDLMPPNVYSTFWGAIVEYIGAGPENLDELLARIDTAWESE